VSSDISINNVNYSLISQKMCAFRGIEITNGERKKKADTNLGSCNAVYEKLFFGAVSVFLFFVIKSTTVFSCNLLKYQRC
jgi:hypothetical protein